MPLLILPSAFWHTTVRFSRCVLYRLRRCAFTVCVQILHFTTTFPLIWPVGPFCRRYVHRVFLTPFEFTVRVVRWLLPPTFLRSATLPPARTRYLPVRYTPFDLRRLRLPFAPTRLNCFCLPTFRVRLPYRAAAPLRSISLPRCLICCFTTTGDSPVSPFPYGTITLYYALLHHHLNTCPHTCRLPPVSIDFTYRYCHFVLFYVATLPPPTVCLRLSILPLRCYATYLPACVYILVRCVTAWCIVLPVRFTLPYYTVTVHSAFFAVVLLMPTIPYLIVRVALPILPFCATEPRVHICLPFLPAATRHTPVG